LPPSHTDSSDPAAEAFGWQSRDFRACWFLTVALGTSAGIVWPLRSLYYRAPWIGLSLQQIGWLGFVQAVTTSAVPIIVGVLSDGSGRRKPWIVTGLALSAAATGLHLASRGFWSLAAVTFALAASSVAYSLNLSALVTTTLHDGSRGKQYGMYRVSGSVGFAVTSLCLLPFVARDTSYATAFLSGAVIYLGCALFARARIQEPSARESVASPWGAWRDVLQERNLVVLYACVAFGSVGGSMGMQFYANHLDETFGMSKAWIGRMMGLAAVVEIPVIILLGRASDRLGRKPLLVFSSIAAGARYALLGVAPSLVWIAVAQAMWGLGLAGSIVSVALITDLVKPSARGTAMGMLQLAGAFGSIVGPPIGGYIAENVGLPVVFRVASGFLVLSGVALAVFLRAPDAPAQSSSSSSSSPPST
jgi:MFS family permease